jgi:radical SAM superfamily enzyme YgiQ (UPF0313 family)
MNVVIVTPGHPSPRGKSFPPALTAPYLAALAAPHVDHIKIIDLAVQPYDLYAASPDIAMFTCTMAQSDHIFKIARYLKANGAKIFLGGPYVTLAYDFDPRIKEIADCVVLGEGEKALPRALEDLKNGNLQPTYAMPINSLAGIPFSRLDLLDTKKYFSSTAVIGTRGCVHKCGYCSIGDIYGQKYLKRPVDEVIEEIKFQTCRPNLRWLDRKFVQFWDDNPGGDLNWFHNLLEKMVPLKKWWISQICLDVADNEETVKLMKASGCKGVFVGIESVSEETLQTQNKDTINVVDNYIRQCRTMLKHGLVVVGAIMFGFDSDTKEILFKKTQTVLENMGITMLNNLVFTPYPHLNYYKTLVKENRLITKEAKYYNGYTVVHRPKNIHPADLQEAVIKMHQKFYSPRSMFKRMIKHNVLKFPEFLIWNRLWGTKNYEVIPGVDVNKWMNYLRTL